MNNTTGNKTINDKNDNMPEQRPDNWYVTDWQTIDFAVNRFTHLFKEELLRDKLFNRYPFRLLDICAGTGRWGRVFAHNLHLHSKKISERYLELNPIFNPLLPESKVEVLNVDLLKPNLLVGYEFDIYEFDIIVGNPDFDVFNRSNFKQFLTNIMDILSNKGWMVLLASSTVLFSDIRGVMYDDYGLKLRHVESLSRRVSFNPLFHPQAGKTGANDHTLLFFKREEGNKQLATISGNKNPAGRDTAIRPGMLTYGWYREDTFLHQLPFGLWDFEFVERDDKGKVIKKDGKTISCDVLQSGSLWITKNHDGFLIQSDINEDDSIWLNRNEIPTIPEWIWNTIS